MGVIDINYVLASITYSWFRIRLNQWNEQSISVGDSKLSKALEKNEFKCLLENENRIVPLVLIIPIDNTTHFWPTRFSVVLINSPFVSREVCGRGFPRKNDRLSLIQTFYLTPPSIVSMKPFVSMGFYFATCLYNL